MKKVTVNREALLHQLQTLVPGIQRVERIEQGNCFVFHDGYIHTFNDNVFCKCKTDFDISCAVPSNILLSTVESLTDKNLRISIGKFFAIDGRKHKTKILVQPEVSMPIDIVPNIDEWFELPETFHEALSIVHPCVTEDISDVIMNCVHFTPTWIEACDGIQAARYQIKLPINGAVLVSKENAAHLLSENATHMALSEHWIHFKMSSGLIMCCKRVDGDYSNINSVFKITDGNKLNISKVLAAAAERATLFLNESKEEGISLQVKEGSATIRGLGNAGEHETTTKIEYDGDPLQIIVSPKSIMHIAAQFSDCIINKEKISIKGKRFRFITMLDSYSGSKYEQTAKK